MGLQRQASSPQEKALIRNGKIDMQGTRTYESAKAALPLSDRD